MTTHIINSDSTVLQQVDGHWQKLAAIIVWKLAGRGVVRITSADIEAFGKEFAPGVPTLFTHGMHDCFEFSVVDAAAAERLVAHDAQMMKGSA